MNTHCLRSLLWVAASLLASEAFAQDLLIRGAHVHTASSAGEMRNADVLVRGGKILDVGTGLPAPFGAVVVQANGRALTPGLFAGLSAIGITEPIVADAGLELNAPAWNQQWRPEFDVTLAYNPRSTVVHVARVEGLTWTVLRPLNADSIIGGRGAAVSLDGGFDAVLRGSRTLFVNLGVDASGLAGTSRAGQFMLLDQAIREVRTAGPIADHSLLHPAGREALNPYLAGGRVVFEVDRAADIRAVLNFAKRHGMKPVIAGGAEAWAVANELARDGVSVVLDPLENLPRDFDRLGARSDNAVLLHKAGVRIAFSEGETYNARRIRQLAGNAVSRGLPRDAALAAITANPAEIFGLGAKLGRIAPGYDADLVLWSDDDPLEITSFAEQVWISGRPVQMRTRQVELLERYLRLPARGTPRT